jgi:hypothetical protein
MKRSYKQQILKQIIQFRLEAICFCFSLLTQFNNDFLQFNVLIG